MFKYNSNKISLQIYFKDITYITRDTIERKLIIYTTNNKFVISLSLHECLKKLDSRFVVVHRACIVNKRRVVEYNWKDKYFILDTNEKVNMLSKKYKEGIENNVN
mgnify:CR=1 FL=1